MLLKERGVMMENTRYKFRAWQKYHKKMVEVTSISFGNTGEINGVSTFVENQAPQRITYKEGLGGFFLTDERGMVLELMQYTGLKDKNGVEIFEGDIVILCWSDEVGESHWGKVIIKNPFEYTPEEARYFIYSDEIEVIGNIYENPELLEVTE